MERDSVLDYVLSFLMISTHTLTWSVTDLYDDAEIYHYNFNSHAHVDRDRLLSLPMSVQKHFNSHAHVERDDSVIVFVPPPNNFNSHAHVERDSTKLN